MADPQQQRRAHFMMALDNIRQRLPPAGAMEVSRLMQQAEDGTMKSDLTAQLRVLLGNELWNTLTENVRALTLQSQQAQFFAGASAPAATGPSPNSFLVTPRAPTAVPTVLLSSVQASSPSPSPLPAYSPAPAPAGTQRPAPPSEAPQAKRARFAVPSTNGNASTAPAPSKEGEGGEDEDDGGGSGGGGGTTMKVLNDVTHFAGLDLKQEAAALDVGGDEDEDDSAAPRVVQPENLVVAPEAVRPIVTEALSRLQGGGLRVDEEVHTLLAHATHERLRSLLEQLVQLSAHRHDAARGHLQATGERDPRRALKAIEKREREAKERRDEEERERLLREAREQEAALRRQKGDANAEALQETRERLSTLKTEDEEVRRTKSTNTTASLAIGDRRKTLVAPVQLPLPTTARAGLTGSATLGVGSTGAVAAPTLGPALSVAQLKELKEFQDLIKAGKALTAEQSTRLAALQAQVQRRPATAPLQRPPRRITKRDLLAVLHTDPASRTCRLLLAPRGKLTSEK